MLPLLSHQHPTNTFVDRFELTQIRTCNLDGITRHWENDDVFPWMEFVFVLDHLRSLPIILNAGALKGELFYLDRDGTAGLRFDDGNIILGLRLKTIRVEKKGIIVSKEKPIVHFTCQTLCLAHLCTET